MATNAQSSIAVPAVNPKSRSRVPLLTVVSLTLVALWLIIAAFPFFWTFWGSFKVQSDFFSKTDWQNAIYGVNTIRQTGSAFTLEGYQGAWVDEEFWRNVINSGIVVFFTVVISLTFGTLGGYALARSGRRYAFWLLLTWMDVEIGFWLAVLIFVFSTLAGGLTGAPGGIGGAEAAMVGLLLLEGIPFEVALPATAVIRATTLWFAILIGLGVFPYAEAKSNLNEGRV